MSRSDILSSWEQVKDSEFGKWLMTETNKVLDESVTQFETLSELSPILRIQGMRQGVSHWRTELADMKRAQDLEVKKSKSGFLARIGLGSGV